MMYMFIKGLQRLCEKSILILVFLIHPSLNFSQVYNIDNEEDISRDDSRVGAELDFNYEIKNKDWYHTGLSIKGKPINEVWSIRDNK